MRDQTRMYWQVAAVVLGGSAAMVAGAMFCSLTFDQRTP